MAERNDLDFCIAVAEKVLLWTRKPKREEEWEGEFANKWYGGDGLSVGYVENEGSCPEDFERGWNPRIHTDDDHDVLAKVRNDWDIEQQEEFWDALMVIWRRRDSIRDQFYASEMQYDPGDYAEAALAVVEA